jgi:hypothetical protein
MNELQALNQEHNKLIWKIKRWSSNISYSLLWFLLSLELSFADGWFLWNFRDDDPEKTETALRNGDIVLKDIPNILKWAIDFFITIAGTIAIIFIIIWSYKILFGSLEGDQTKWKDTIIMAISWFAIASLAWFIVKLIIDNLS